MACPLPMAHWAFRPLVERSINSANALYNAKTTYQNFPSSNNLSLKRTRFGYDGKLHKNNIFQTTRLFRYLNEITLKCLYATFIIAIACYARASQYFIPVCFKSVSKRIHIRLGTNTESCMNIPRTIEFEMRSDYFGTLHKFQSCSISKSLKISLQSGVRIIVHIICRSSEITHKKLFGLLQVQNI